MAWRGGRVAVGQRVRARQQRPRDGRERRLEARDERGAVERASRAAGIDRAERRSSSSRAGVVTKSLGAEPGCGRRVSRG